MFTKLMFKSILQIDFTQNFNFLCIFVFVQRSLSVTVCGRLLPCCSARVATLPKNVQLESKQNIRLHCFLMSVPPDIQPPKIHKWIMATLIRDHFKRKGSLYKTTIFDRLCCFLGGCKWLIMGGYLKKYFYKCSSFFQLMFGVPKCNPYKPKSKQYQRRQKELTGTTAKSFAKPVTLQKIHKNDRNCGYRDPLKLRKLVAKK